MSAIPGANAGIIKLYLEGLIQFGLRQTERCNDGVLCCFEDLAAQQPGGMRPAGDGGDGLSVRRGKRRLYAKE